MISKEDEKGFVREMSSAAKHLDDVESALGRSDKAISALTEELSILKNLVGQEVGLRHIYSGIVHIGILDELTPDYLIISQNNSTTQLKISNVEVINNEDLLQMEIKELYSE